MSDSTPFLTIETIFTRSFGITFRLCRHFLIFYLALIGAAVANSSLYSHSENFLLLIVTVGTVSVADIYIFLASALVAFQLWRGEEPELPEYVLKKIDLLLIFEVIWMTARLTLTSIPLFLCLIIPGLVYLLNRILAMYLLISERTTVSEALRESKRLMTAEPWYTINGPQLRISGLLFAVTLFSIGIAIVTLIGSAILGMLATLMPNPLGDIFVKIILPFGAAALQQFITIYNCVVAVGFCIDLSNRYRLTALPK